MTDQNDILNDRYFVSRNAISTTKDVTISPRCWDHQVAVGAVVGTPGGSSLITVYGWPAGLTGEGDEVSLGTIQIDAPVVLQFSGAYEKLRFTVSDFEGTSYTVTATGAKEASDATADLAELVNSNTRETVTINMANDNYQMTAEESLCKNLSIVYVGDGTKTLTLYDSADNPGEYNLISLPAYGGGTFSFSAEGTSVPVFGKGQVIYVNGLSLFNKSLAGVHSGFINYTSTPANASRELMHSIYIPPNTLIFDGDSLFVQGNCRKSAEGVNTYSISFSLDATATAGDGTKNIWSNASLAAGNKSSSFGQLIYRKDATTIRASSLPGSVSANPYGVGTAAFVEVAVADLNTTGFYINVVCLKTAGADANETVTLNLIRADYQGATS